MLDTLELYEELAGALTPEAARVLANAMARLYKEIAFTVTKEEFAELRSIVGELAQAQQRTESRLEELAQAQQRTESRLEELAQAQQRTESRLEELAQAQQRTESRLEELAQAQQRTEQRVEELAHAQQRTEEEVRKLAKGLRETRQMVGGLSDTVGYVLEDRAIHSLPSILPDRAGVTVVGSLRRTFVQHPDGRKSELNIFGKGTTAAGATVSILGEAKSRLARKHVDGLVRLAARLERDGLIEGEPVLLLVTYSADPEVESYASSKGVLVIPSYELQP